MIVVGFREYDILNICEIYQLSKIKNNCFPF